MKRYINSSTNTQRFSIIEQDIENYVEDYYGLMGYEEDEYTYPVCVIQKEGDKYKVSVEFFTLDTYDVDEICEELTNRTYASCLPEYRLTEDFSWDGDYTFTGYIEEA